MGGGVIALPTYEDDGYNLVFQKQEILRLIINNVFIECLHKNVYQSGKKNLKRTYLKFAGKITHLRNAPREPVNVDDEEDEMPQKQSNKYRWGWVVTLKRVTKDIPTDFMDKRTTNRASGVIQV